MEPVSMARSGAVTHAPGERDSHKHHIKRVSLFELPIEARKGQPQTPYQAEFSVRIAHRSPDGTATSTISSRFLCSNCPSKGRKGQPQTPYQADFSVRIAHRSPEGTATNTISSGFLCSNGPRRRVPWPAWLSWRQQQKLSAVFGIPTYALRHVRRRDQ